MQIRFLLNDHEEATHKDLVWEFNEQATLRQLKDIISFKLNIPQERIFFLVDGRNSNEFDLDSQLPQIGLRHMDKLIVKHSLLSSWSALLECEAAFRQTNEQELKNSIYLNAKGLIDTLNESQFFLSYPALGTLLFSIEKKFLTYLDRKVESIKNSCRIYFTKIYGEDVKVSFRSREGGSGAGCLCIVDDQSVISKFYAKTHHGAGDKSSNTRYDIDLKFKGTFCLQISRATQNGS